MEKDETKEICGIRKQADACFSSINKAKDTLLSFPSSTQSLVCVLSHKLLFLCIL